jgi:site-specific recombinase XerD
MADKGALSAIDSAGGLPGSRVEQAIYHPVDRSADVGAALEALDAARQALVYAAAAAEAAALSRAAHAENTLRGYGADWRDFTRWCAANGVPALPARHEDIAVYVAYSARTKAAVTIRRRLAAIAHVHVAGGHPDPTKAGTVKAVLRGLQRSRAARARRKTPLVVEAMRAVLAQCDDGARGRRDRALLLIGWGAALRRSEIVALDMADLQIADEGLVVYVRRSKIDQFGRGEAIGIPHAEDRRYDAVAAYLDWRAVALADRGAVFRPVTRTGWVLERRLQPREVARIVKRVADRAGLAGDYSGHSLRAGFATAAAAAGASERSIMAQTRHRSVTVMRGYIRPASIWLDNAAAIAAL